MIENGIDFVKISRFEKFADNSKFLDKYFSPNEIEYILSKTNKMQTIAGLYCAKEAFLKALKIGIGAGLDLKEISICHTSTGSPYIEVSPKIDYFLSKLSCSNISISISHDDDFAISFCILS